MKASIYDVAKRAGVSVVTVSRVINHAPTVRQTSIDKVNRAIKELNYSPNAAARSLAGGKSRAIGMVIPDVTDPFIMGVVKHTSEKLREANYYLSLVVANDQEEVESYVGNFLFQSERVDGVILLTPLFEKDYVTMLQQRSIPFVILDNQQYPFLESSVVVDNFKAGYDAAMYLYQKGHKKIAHIGGPQSLLTANDRTAGFLKALEDVGANCYAIHRGLFEINEGYETVKTWHLADALPDAIFAADDHIAFGAMNYLKDHGINIPTDVSLIGFDDHPFSEAFKPNLTTFRQPMELMAQRGVDLLLKIMKGDHKRHSVVKLEAELIERDSVCER